jgi:hypothetical protein
MTGFKAFGNVLDCFRSLHVSRAPDIPVMKIDPYEEVAATDSYTVRASYVLKNSPKTY